MYQSLEQRNSNKNVQVPIKETDLIYTNAQMSLHPRMQAILGDI